MWRPDPKAMLRSKTVWFGLLAAINGVATIYVGANVDLAGKLGLTQDQASQLASMFFDAALATGGFSLTGGLGAIAGRLAATRPVTVSGSPPFDPGKLAVPRASVIPWEDAAARPSPGRVDVAENRIVPGRSVTLPVGIVLALALAVAGCAGDASTQLPNVATPTPADARPARLAAACEDWARTLDGFTTAIRSGRATAAGIATASSAREEAQEICTTSSRPTDGQIETVRKDTATVAALTAPKTTAVPAEVRP